MSGLCLLRKHWHFSVFRVFCLLQLRIESNICSQSIFPLDLHSINALIFEELATIFMATLLFLILMQNKSHCCWLSCMAFPLYHSCFLWCKMEAIDDATLVYTMIFKCMMFSLSIEWMWLCHDSGCIAWQSICFSRHFNRHSTSNAMNMKMNRATVVLQEEWILQCCHIQINLIQFRTLLVHENHKCIAFDCVDVIWHCMAFTSHFMCAVVWAK